MFPKKERLARDSFPTALKGRRISSPNFTAIAAHNASGCAVVVSKKVARLSVTRHKLKRRILSVVRVLPLPRALIIFPKVGAQRIKAKDIKEELGGLLSKFSK